MGTDWKPWITAWHGRWKRMALPALLGLDVATSVAPASPADAASPGSARADTVHEWNGEYVKQTFGPPGDPHVYFLGESAWHITIGFGPGPNADHLETNEYHVRWRRTPSEPEHAENVGQRRTFWITKPFANDDAPYSFSVQRCAKVLIGKDNCTGWTVVSIRGF